MASSSHEAIPVKLPVPPSLPPKPKKRPDDDSIASRALAALADKDDDDEPPSSTSSSSSSSSLDAHIRWTVESGAIVQKGERIATLFYSYRGSPPPPPSANGGASSSGASNGNGNGGGNGNIRARMKKKRWAVAVPGSGSLANTITTNKAQVASSNGNCAASSLPKDGNNFTIMQIRSHSAGFLRILYKKPFALNAVQINNEKVESVINLILAAIEPCEHPAVVGGLCAVCGEDTRVQKPKDVCEIIDLVDDDDDDDDNDDDDDPIPRRRPSKNNNTTTKPQSKDLSREGNALPKEEMPRKQAPVVDSRQQQIIDKQKRLAALMGSTKEFDDECDDELADFDMEGVIASQAKGGTTGAQQQSSSNITATNNPTPPVIPKKLTPPKPTTVTKPKPKAPLMRSLSSLLSGAKATQKMQQIPAPRQKQKQPSSQHNRHMAAAASRVRSRQQMASATSSNQSSSNANATNDPKFSKMTVSGGVTITISETEAKNISEGQSKKLREEKKLCLVLDLDHTLLHATDDYRAGRFVAQEVRVGEEKNLMDEGDDDDKIGEGGNDKESKTEEGADSKPSATNTKPNPDMRGDVRSILLPVELPPAQQQQYVQTKLQQSSQEDTHFCLSPLPQQGQSVGASSHIIMRHFIKLRPHLKEFLTQISSSYQLSVYTAGTRSYAEQVAVMICRHLVGAPLDEEDLNSLRAKVRKKEEECRKYRDYKAKVGRRKQLEMLERNGWGDEEGEDSDAVGKGDAGNGKKKSDGGKRVGLKKKGVSFSGGSNTDSTGNDKAKSDKSSKNDGKTTGINAKNNPPKKSTSADAAEKESNSAPDNDAGERKASSQKRSIASGDNDKKTSIPRKRKKRTNSGTGSLLALLPTETESAKKKVEKSQAEEEELADPTEERDRLKKELEKAEKLEIAAVELRRKMFGSRIVSRTDVGDLGKDVKSLKRVFPCGGVMAAILDDREDVWANAKNNVTGRPGEPPDNLLLVKPYHWKPFMGYADVNNASGNDLSTNDDAQQQRNVEPSAREDDVQLLWTADILRRLHERYYSPTLSQEERGALSVPSLLQSMRRETLLRFPRVKVVFSGLIPINRQNQRFQIRPHVVRYAEELGAEVLSGISSEVTHVVAARDGSEKIRQARKEVPGCYVVHTSWLMECFWSISRRDVRPHHIGPVPTQQHPKQRQQRAIAMSNNKKEDAHSKEGGRKSKATLLLDSNKEEEDSSDDDDSEDDFAADLENEMLKKDDK